VFLTRTAGVGFFWHAESCIQQVPAEDRWWGRTRARVLSVFTAAIALRDNCAGLRRRRMVRRKPVRARELIRWRESFLASIASTGFLQAMFDTMPDVVFCIKDRQGRYVLMSEACVERCGLHRKQDAIGKTAFALFPVPMAERYTRQDEQLFKTGKPIIDSLDL